MMNSRCKNPHHNIKQYMLVDTDRRSKSTDIVYKAQRNAKISFVENDSTISYIWINIMLPVLLWESDFSRELLLVEGDVIISEYIPKSIQSQIFSGPICCHIIDYTFNILSTPNIEEQLIILQRRFLIILIYTWSTIQFSSVSFLWKKQKCRKNLSAIFNLLLLENNLYRTMTVLKIVHSLVLAIY